MSEERNEAGTPRALFDRLNAEYAFTIDVAAVAWNAKLPRYLTPADDALSCHWRGERAYINPPFKNIPPFLAHALEPDLAVFLLPVRSDREWWRRFKPLAEVHYFVGEAPHARVQYEPPPGIKYSSNATCDCLLCFGGSFTPGRELWRSGRTGELL